MAFVLFGLTGGLACGKSAVAAHWKSRRLPVIDADELAREVVARGSDGLREIALAFGPAVITESGDLDRRRLAARAFADAAERKRLEAIVHPRITAASRARAAELERAGEPLACYEATLLVERGIAQSFRPLVVVTANEETQIARAVARGGISADEARARLRAQATTEQKAALADWIIANDGDIEALRARADHVLDAVCRSTGLDPSRYPVRRV